MKKYMLAALTVFMLGAAPFAAHAGQELHHQLEASSPHKNAGRLGSAAGIAPAGGGKRTIGKALHAQFHHTAACGAQPLQYWGIHPVRAG